LLSCLLTVRREGYVRLCHLVVAHAYRGKSTLLSICNSICSLSPCCYTATTHRVDCKLPFPLGSARACRSSLLTHRHVLRAPAPSEYHTHFPADGWQSCGDTHRHTAHPSSMAQIWSSHHPCCGPTVEIVRWLRRQPAESLVVKLSAGVQIAIAAWRRAPLACRQLPDTPPPCVRGDALLALRDVREHSLLLHIPAPATSGASPRKGGRDAPEPSQPPPASGGGALAPANRLAAASRVTTPAVPRPHCAAAHGPGARRTERGA